MASTSMEISRSDTPMLEPLSLHETDEVEDAPGSPVSSDGDGSEESDTSTLRYDQEPYRLFKSRVEGLCQVLWPAQQSFGQSWANSRIARLIGANKLLSIFAPPKQEPLIERLRGGDYNRIIGITLPSSKRGDHIGRSFILRVPRWDRGQTDKLVATLEYLRQNSSIPTAKVVAKDFSEDNVLGSPYVVQNRLPGSDLEILWNDLTHSQRCTVARELGSVVKSLLALESPVTGYIKSVDEGTRSSKKHVVVPFDLKSADGDVFDEPEPPRDENATTSSPRQSQSTLDFFRCQIARWRAVDVDGNAPLIGRTLALWDGMLKIINEMDELGLFKSLNHCLCHVDLYPRNIMASIQPDTTILITGILDWDEAVLAPKFVACEPPSWLWGFDPDQRPPPPNNNDDLPAWPYEKPGADDLPATEENRQLKKIFEEAAGGEYVRMAYGEEWRMCRGLFRVAVFGLTSSENYDAAERIVGDWERLKSRGMAM